jgi:predicted negative regulator of RcsB-dependent stress response
MATRKAKAEVKKPDFLLRFIDNSYQFVKANLKLCVIGLVACLLIVSAVYGYALYDKNKNDKIQYSLSQAIKAFDTYIATGKADDLAKAEASFKEVSGKKGDASFVASLYLARIEYVRGKKEDALKLYKELLQRTSDPDFKPIVEKSITQLEKK